MTAVSDPLLILNAMKSEFDLRGGKIMTGYKVTLKEHNFKLIHSTGNFIAKQFINDK